MSAHPSVVDTQYRYTLTRGGWDGYPARGRLCWVMLNPSTADETSDDPTIRRVIRFTRDAGYASLVVVNRFAARTTRPVHLLEMTDPIGQYNWDAVRDAMDVAGDVVFAWGAWPKAHLGLNVVELARLLDIQPLCLGTTKDGAPRHPLYVRGDQPFLPYMIAAHLPSPRVEVDAARQGVDALGSLPKTERTQP